MRMGLGGEDRGAADVAGGLKGAAHCGAGCALGDFAAEWIALGLGLVLLGSALAARLTLSFVLAYAAGIAFQYFAIAPMRGLSFRAGLVAAVKADTFSLVAYELACSPA